MDLAGFLVAKALDTVSDKFLDDVGTQIIPRLTHIEAKIDRVETRLDQYQTGRLISGLRLLSKGKFEQAGDVLLQLDDSEPDGAITKLAAAAVLQRLGDSEDSARYVAEAVMQNPFIAPALALRLDRLLAIWSTEQPAGWTVDFESLKPDDARKSPWDSIKSLQDLRRHNIVVTAVAAGYSPVEETGHVAVGWCRQVSPWPHTARLPGQHVVTIFDLASGQRIWSRTTNEELFSATPRYVVLRSTGRPFEFRLVNPHRQRETVMPEAYFGAIFWPGWEQLDVVSDSGIPESATYLQGHAGQRVAEDIGAVYHYMHRSAVVGSGRNPRQKPRNLNGEAGLSAKDYMHHPCIDSESAVLLPLFSARSVHATNTYTCQTSGLTHNFGSSAELAVTPSPKKLFMILPQLIIDLTEQVVAGDVRLADRVIDRHVRELQAKSSADKTGARIDNLGLMFRCWLGRAKSEVSQEERRSAVELALSWTHEHRGSRTTVLAAAPYLGVPTNTPSANFLSPLSADELWGMWAVVCGLVQVVEGDTTAFLAGLDRKD